jgi:hypothetical protein
MYKLSVLAMFKNESWIIEEWIKHYLSEGVEHFYLIDNGSTDDFLEKIKNYMSQITLVRDDTRLPSGTQSFLYTKHFLNIIKSETKWIIVCDVDEYIYSRNEFTKVIDFLNSVPEHIERIWIPWKIFGSNGHINHPNNIVKAFTKRKNSFYKINTGFGKCIAKTTHLINFGCCGHDIHLNSNNIMYLPNLKPLSEYNKEGLNDDDIESFKLHLNHYMTMSEQYYREIKCIRGGGESGITDKYKLAFFYDNQQKYNIFEDLELLKKKNPNHHLQNILTFKPNDINLFKKYIEKSKYYLEFGSGNSTRYASSIQNIKKIFSIETDSKWYNKMKNILNLPNNKIDLILVDLKVDNNGLGYPGSNSNLNDWIAYSDSIKIIDKNIDLILIDGRFRVACCLKCYNIINDNCIILFNDFLYRDKYHEILKYFFIIDKTNDNSMVALKKNPYSIPPLEIIQKYESIKD